MPKDTAIKKILVVGSGPIIIGQGCEFDYSGAQACKALKEEGYLVTLVNSNPATIMTDPELADATYIEPITPPFIEKIIQKEKPDALLPTLGGQTGLNASMSLHRQGILQKYNVKLIGADAKAIEKGENRALFKKAMQKINLDLPKSKVAHTIKECLEVAEYIGTFPLIIRPAYTLGGAGGGIATNEKELLKISENGLKLSPVTEVLIEESLLGWKEYEMEVMRDKADNCVIICSIENLDPMGIHTGDSITVAPIQTLSDREFQTMRDASFAVIREIGVETGGSNIQFAVEPQSGRQCVIEMNPRVSRSSALASKATGFPIARIAAKLAIGYTLDEIPNPITRETMASFEPAIDYTVVKMPRFTFEKFPDADARLTTQMKSVGEAMAIGRSFPQALQKAARSLETGRDGIGFDKNNKSQYLSEEQIEQAMKFAEADRIFHIHEAFIRGFTLTKIQKLTGIDPWFLAYIKQIVDFGKELAKHNLTNISKNKLQRAKELGFSDSQIANIFECKTAEIRSLRKTKNILPRYRLVDTCAAEFPAYTPYYYSDYGTENESKLSDKKRIMILGGGPNRIGQGIEFDYCCVHASYALRELGYESIMVNSNPETVSTDFDTSDKLYFEPLTVEDVLNICDDQKPDGVIVQFGGQTPLKLAQALHDYGVPIIGTSPENINLAEDREEFSTLLDRLELQQASAGFARNRDEALQVAAKIGYPVLARPSFVLGGRAMAIVENESELEQYIDEAVDVSEDRPILIDRFLHGAMEADVDCICDGETAVVGAVMEHIEQAGIHSGDSACVIPAVSFREETCKRIIAATKKLAFALNVRGLMNVQFAVQVSGAANREDEIFVIEANPRASRTVPFVSKSVGVPLAKIAAKVMTGVTLKELGYVEALKAKRFTVKEAVFPFNKFPGASVSLSPEMKSTGEVMGISKNFPAAFAKSQIATGAPLPEKSSALIAAPIAFHLEIAEFASVLADCDFSILAKKELRQTLLDESISKDSVIDISDEDPNIIIEKMRSREIGIFFSLASGKKISAWQKLMRDAATSNNIPIITTLSASHAAALAIKAVNDDALDVESIQSINSLS